MTNKEIVARRKGLEEQFTAVLKNYYKANGELASAKRDSQRAQSEVQRARVEFAKGQISGEVLDAAIEKTRTTSERLEQVKAQGHATYTARGELERQIDGLLAKHFDVFAAQAEEQTARAAKALQLANRAILAAENAWRSSAEAWRPLCRAAGIAGVPPFPLSRADTIPARPPSVQVEDEAA